MGAAAALTSDGHLRDGRVDTDDVSAQLGDAPRDLAFTTPDIDDARRPGQVLVDQREHLLLVLGIGAVGVPLLPPPRVPLPGIGSLF